MNSDTDTKNEKDEIGFLIIAHGQATASSMADVCNRLYGERYVYAVDMPLDRSVNDTYDEALALIKNINKNKGILLFVDMGSLVSFGERLKEQTGILVRTITSVSTPLVLDAISRVINKKESVNMVYDSLEGKKEEKKIKINSLKKAILTICTTGEGSGKILKEIIDKDLKENNLNDIQVIALNYNESMVDSDEYIKIISEYEIILTAGIIDPGLNVPFFHLENLITFKQRKKIYKYIKENINFNLNEDEKPEDVFSEGAKILTDYVSFVNPVLACKYIKKFVLALEIEGIILKEALKLALTLHMGCMLDRKIKGIEINFEDKNNFIKENNDLFSLVKKELKVVEDRFSLKVSDDEICFIVQVINKF